MEARMGADFGERTGAHRRRGHQSARSVNAQAYTVGSNIVFEQDGTTQASDQGKHMLAHELTHVVQQRSGPVDGTDTGGGVKVSDPSGRFEREAVANADRVMSSPAPAWRRPACNAATGVPNRSCSGRSLPRKRRPRRPTST